MTPNKPILLVTGGSGYIGSALTKAALAAGYRLHILDSAPLPADPVLDAAAGSGDIRMFSGSIADRGMIRDSIRGAHGVVHLAGVSDGRAGKADPELTRRINTGTIAGLLDEAASAGVRQFVFASTMGVYGNRYTCPLTEDLDLAPADPYSESKAAGEHFVHAADAASMRAVSLRIAMVYGAGVRIREDFLVNRMCLQAVEEGTLQIVGGTQRRPQIHIDDLTAVMLRLVAGDAPEVHGRAVNVVESSPDLLQIAAAITRVLPETRVQVSPADMMIDTFDMSGDRLLTDLHYQPRYDLEKGIRQTIEYFQHRPKQGGI